MKCSVILFSFLFLCSGHAATIVSREWKPMAELPTPQVQVSIGSDRLTPEISREGESDASPLIPLGFGAGMLVLAKSVRRERLSRRVYPIG
jgi:hypothetical protein